LIFYQLKLVVAENKLDEFIDSLRLLLSGIREEQGCLDFSLYRDLGRQDAYRVLGEWKTRQAMEAHFKREKFSVLIGATRVLGEDFEMSIGETLEKGSYHFAQAKISLHPGSSNQ
jgi:quinol monooxygenase YgiN